VPAATRARNPRVRAWQMPSLFLAPAMPAAASKKTSNVGMGSLLANYSMSYHELNIPPATHHLFAHRGSGTLLRISSSPPSCGWREIERRHTITQIPTQPSFLTYQHHSFLCAQLLRQGHTYYATHTIYFAEDKYSSWRHRTDLTICVSYTCFPLVLRTETKKGKVLTVYE
jgi:hypothetical protein